MVTLVIYCPLLVIDLIDLNLFKDLCKELFIKKYLQHLKFFKSYYGV